MKISKLDSLSSIHKELVNLGSGGTLTYIIFYKIVFVSASIYHHINLSNAIPKTLCPKIESRFVVTDYLGNPATVTINQNGDIETINFNDSHHAGSTCFIIN